MSLTVVFLGYAVALVIAVWLASRVHSAWYWHVAAIAVALVLGLLPTPDPFVGNRVYDLVVGCLVVFAVVWGLAEIFAHRYHGRR